MGLSRDAGAAARRSIASETAELWLETEYRPVVAMLARGGPVGERHRRPRPTCSVAEERYRLLRTHDWSDEVLQRVIEGRSRRRHRRG